MKGIGIILAITAITGCSQTSKTSPMPEQSSLTEVYRAPLVNIGMPTVIGGEIVGTDLDKDGSYTPSIRVPFNQAAKPTVLGSQIRGDGRSMVEYGGTIVAFNQDSSLTIQTNTGSRNVPLPQGFWSLKKDMSGGMMSTFRSRVSLNGSLVIVPHPAGIAAYSLKGLADGNNTPAWTVTLPQRPGLTLPGDRPDHQLRSMSVDVESGVTVYSWSRYGEEGFSPTFVSAVSLDGSELWSLKAVNPTEEMGSRLVVVGAGEGIAAFHVTGESRLRAVDIRTGKQRWEAQDVRCETSDIFSHVVINGGTVFPVSSGDSCVLALNLDGTQRWKYKGDGRTFGGVPAIHHGVVYAANGQINAIDLKSGELLGKSSPVRSTQRESSSVVISPDGQYVAAWGDELGVYRTLR